MILSQKSRDYFKLLQAKVFQAMAKHQSPNPYLLDDDPVIRNYEIIRHVWVDGAAGVLLEDTYASGKARYTLFWVKDEMLYALTGDGYKNEATLIANSMQ